MADFFKKLIREPLLHFVLLGALIFGCYTIWSKGNEEPSNIVITKGEIASIISGFVNMRQRQPTPEEFDGLIRERVRQDVYRREAIALGLDKDDIIIERRLQQKMEFIVEDNLEEVIPTDAELQQFLLKHPDQFKAAPRFSFQQVFLDPMKHGSSIEKDAVRMLALLNKNDSDVKKISDPTLLPPELSNAKAVEVSGDFGNDFLLAIQQLPTGKWEGPVKSAYGLHLVKINKIEEGGTAALQDVRAEVSREWNNARLKEANEKLYKEMLKNYKVTIEQ